VDSRGSPTQLVHWWPAFIRYAGARAPNLGRRRLQTANRWTGVKSDPQGGEIIDRDSPTFDYTSHVTYLKVCFATAILYFTLVTAIKISILLLYRRIFSTAYYRLRLHVVCVAVVSWWLTGTLATILSCIPAERLWRGSSVGGYCFNYNIFWMAMGTVELVIDTVILVLPVPMVLGLQLCKKQKVLLAGIFLLGGLCVSPLLLPSILLSSPAQELLSLTHLHSVIITGVLRVTYGYKPGSQNVAFSKAELWSSIHVGIAIVCACLPTLRPLFIRSFTSASAPWHRRYYQSNDSSSDGGLKSRHMPSISLSMTRSQDEIDRDVSFSQVTVPKTALA
jgi:hypothetical protein